ENVAKFSLVSFADDISRRKQVCLDFIDQLNSHYPIVLKPDYGERGNLVKIVKSEAELDEYLAGMDRDTVIQEYIEGVEFGVFYIRMPNQENGFIFSITDKQFTSVTGDGKRNLEQLILDDDRAVCMAKRFLFIHRNHLKEIPAEGERIKLVEIGTHSKGALFLDAIHLKTTELEAKIDEISKRFNGFYFGRYDIRVPSIADFQAGRNLKIVELNGVTSEATHIYDPKNSYRDAYTVLMQQWRYAFEIAAVNRDNGLKPESFIKMLRLSLFH
ncbi:MAG: hypothetical protein KDD94_08255, partial [Calditrichaeota bacterium]|nr:hypothetical protein [Calditrichota bacterium]